MASYEEQKEYLQSIAGYLVFVDKEAILQKFKCHECGKVAIKYNVANCNHVFCTDCISALACKSCLDCKNNSAFQRFSNIFKRSPPLDDKENFDIKETRDEEFEKEILDLIVECQNKSHGCLAVLPLRELQEHVCRCQYSINTLLPKELRGRRKSEELQEIKTAMKEITNKMEIIKKDVEKLKTSILDVAEMKTISNDYENMKTTFTDVEKLKTQQATETDRRKEAEKEISQNVLTIEEKLSDLCYKASHITMPQKNTVLPDVDADMEMQGCTSEDGNEPLGKFPVFTWRIKGFQKEWDAHKYTYHKIFESDIFHDEDSGLQFCAQLYCHPSQDLLIFLGGYKCKPAYCFGRKFTLIDQSDRTENKHISFLDTPFFSKEYSIEHRNNRRFYWDVLAVKGLFDKEYKAYVSDDSMIIKISMIPLALMWKTIASDNGVLLWRIDNYSKKKQDELNGFRRCLSSPSFCTSPQGYRVQAFLFLNGRGAARHQYLSINVAFVMGEFDYLLSKPFSGRMWVLVFDQSDAPKQEHIGIQFDFINRSRNFMLLNQYLERHSTTEEPKYLKDDTLLLKLMVEIL